MSDDILGKYYRVPKIFISLPSGIDYYKNNVEYSIDRTIPILAMTAKDELILKSPDALLNGESIVHIIKSCVPTIKDPKQLLANDVEAIILGILFSSYGDSLRFSNKCPNCKEHNDFEASIRDILTRCDHLDFPYIVEKDIGVIEGVQTFIRTHVKPYTFETYMKSVLKAFEYSKMLQALTNDKLSDEEKIAAYNTSFNKMSELKYKAFQECVEKIEVASIVNGEEKITSVEDIESIKKYLENAESNQIAPIEEKISLINSVGVNKTFLAKCKKCEHEWTTNVETNPSNFFSQSSKR